MLLFELFPAFVAVVSAIAVVWLMMVDRSARASNEPEDPIARPNPQSEDDDGRPSLRPSMRA